MSVALTIQEIEALLDAFWEDTAKWDPWINGTMDAELAGLDPNAPDLTLTERADIRAKREAICDRYEWEHEIAVGRRTAVQTLRYRFREATNTPDPITEVFRQSYKALSAYFDAGGTVADLTFGPIELVPDRAP